MSQVSFGGTGVALVTPFTQSLSVDYPSLKKLVYAVIRDGVDYLVALGTTAETPTLSAAERTAVLEFIIEQAAGQVPVVCGAGGNNTAEVIAQMKEWAHLPVAAWLSVTPYYNKPTQEGVYRHFSAIAQSTDKPIILYNVPGRTVTNMAPATVLRLAVEFENIVAIKEASGSLPQCMELVAGKPQGFQVLSGDDNLVVAQIAIGMEGVISVAANCWTQTFTSAVKSALSGDFKEANKGLYRLLPGIDLLFVEGNPAGVKAVLAQSGTIENYLRLPLVPASEDLCSRLRKLPAL